MVAEKFQMEERERISPGVKNDKEMTVSFYEMERHCLWTSFEYRKDNKSLADVRRGSKNLTSSLRKTESLIAW